MSAPLGRPITAGDYRRIIAPMNLGFARLTGRGLREGIAPSLRMNRILILTFSILGCGWLMTLYYEKSLWVAFLSPDTFTVEDAYKVFFIAITASLALGAFVIRRGNLRPILNGSLGACLLLTLGLWLLKSEGGKLVLFSAMGVCGGFMLMAVTYIVIFGFGPGTRLVPCLIVITGCLVIVASLELLAPRAPVDGIMFFLAVLLALALAISLCVSPRFLDRMDQIPEHPFPFKTIAAFGAALCLLYASNYFIHGLSGQAEEHMPFLPGWVLAWTPRFAVFGAIIAARRKLNVVALGYMTALASIALAVCGLLTGLRSPLSFAVIAMIDGLGEFFVDTMLMDLARKHGRSPAVLVACMATIALGTFAGDGLSKAATGVSEVGEAGDLAILLVMNCLLLAVLPLLYRVLQAELGIAVSARAPLGRADGASGPELARADTRPIAEHFQGEYELTPRELEIVGYLLERYDYRSIAGRLDISVNTLKVHVRHIYEKCDVTSRRDLIDLFRTIAVR
jgi:DNA-binding CsgD family transcriptional regulator